MMQKILPPRLDKSKSIGIIAPADPVAGVCPEDTIKRGYEYLRSKGFSIVEGRSVKLLTQKHTAGTASFRIEDIHDFAKRDDIGCIMAFWGGFNTNQLLDQLDYELIKKNPKIFIGYSDVTALTTAITTKTGLITFSGPGVISFAKPEPFDYTWDYFEKMCIKPQEDTIIESSKEYADDLYFLRKDNDHRIKKANEGIKVFNQGDAVGEVVAGNLQTLLILQGTQYLPNMTGKILFIEEDETSTPAHVDRFIYQCKQLGWFDKIAGLVIGRFTEQSSFSSDDSLEDILKEYFSDAKFPVLYNVDFGHSDPLITIPNGGIAEINTKEKRITFKKAVV
ncbi:MAG: LD-carboxypeptidase [Candidatus Moranbacteria bacterium]|jgi:muramoyltetrapeptide carboxypeptidase|nr:LD-carboxypeptidase [Candidatus Moranbacteria bacterium]